MEYLNAIYEAFIKSGGSISTDSRKIENNTVYFALKGDNFNGNEFASDAINKGAALAVIDEEKYSIQGKTILVPNVLQALQELARFHRRKFKIPVIGITGSNGKTTSKELIAAVLSKKYNTLFTQGNLNNHIGVPLTLLGLKPEHEMAIIEMGANHQGEIDLLSKIAEPDYGVITNIGKAHLEGFGGIEGVKKGKSELYRFLEKNKGVVFLHGDDEVLHDLSINNEKITYGTRKLYDVVGKMGENDGMVSFAWKTRYTATELKNAVLVKTNLVGTYNYHNLLCAAAIGHHFHVEESLINEALSSYTPNNNRSQIQQSENNRLILDYYNANPSSMEAAIKNFASMIAEKKFLILGDMLELGEETQKEHEKIISLMKEKNLNDYLLVGKNFCECTQLNSCTDSHSALDKLSSLQLKGYLILVKGSRGIALEKTLPAL